MKAVTFLLLWTLLFLLLAWGVLRSVKRHEKVYLLLVLDALYLSGVFEGYRLLVGAP